MKRARIAIIAVAVGLVAGCAPVVAPTGADHTPPRITLTVLNAPGNPSFSTSDPMSASMGACAKVRSFPAKLSVAVADESGMQMLALKAFPGRISDASVAPATATATVTRDDARNSDFLTVTPHPPSGLVQPNLLVTLTVSELSAITVDAYDTRGNGAHLYQVDLRPPDSPVVCGGQG